MPLNTRVFNFLDGLDPDVKPGAAIVKRYEELLRKLRSKANDSQLRRAYAGEPANFGLKLGGMQQLQDLKALGEFLGLEDPFELRDDPTARNRAILAYQNQNDLDIRIAEVGTPNEIQQQVSQFIAATIQDVEAAVGGFSGEGVNRSLDLFLRNYVTENHLFSLNDLQDDPNFNEAAGNFTALVESRERVAEYTRILNSEDLSELEALAQANGIDIANQAQLMQQQIVTDRQTVNQVIAANPDSLITRTYKQATDSEWISGETSEVNDRTYSLIPDSDWNNFLLSLPSTEVRDYFEQNRDYVETQYNSRGDKTTGFLLWSGTEFLPETQSVVDRFGSVNFGFRPDPTLDPLINSFISDLPVAMRANARDRLKEFIATLQQGPGQDKAALWVEFLDGEHGETPEDVVDRYISDLITQQSGGAEFVEAARASGIKLTSLAADTGNPVEWLKSITDNGTAQGLPPVSAVNQKELNIRAWVIEMMGQDPDMKNAPAVIRNAIYGEATRQLSQLGFDPLTTSSASQYANALNNQIGVSAIKSNVLESIVRNSGPDGDLLWEDLKRQQEATGAFSPDSILTIFNDLEGIDKDTLLIENLNVQLETATENLGPTPEEAALAGFAEKTRNLPTALQGTANARIQSFLATFVGEDPVDVLERQDVQDRIALIIEGVGQEFLGSSDVVDLAVSSYGGLNEFFAAFPELQESDVVTIQDFVVDNFDTILEGASPDAEVGELQRAKARVESDRKREELSARRQELQNQAEERALEFDESEQGQQLAVLAEDERRRQENLSVFNPELERAVRGRISGPAASQVLADVGPQLQRQFLSQREAQFNAEQAGTQGLQAITPESFLSNLGEDFFVRERRRSNIRRSPVNVGAPQFAGLGQGTGPGFTPRRGGL